MNPQEVPYLPGVDWYRDWFGSRVGRPAPTRASKQAVNRGCIRGAWGEQTLTVPIAGGRRKLGHVPYSGLHLSEHDDWRHKHWQAITSAYGAMPYFPYFKEEFAPVFTSGPIDRLSELCGNLHQAFLRCSRLEELSAWLSAHPAEKRLTPRPAEMPGHISALELLFMHGPETIFYLL